MARVEMIVPPPAQGSKPPAEFPRLSVTYRVVMNLKVSTSPAGIAGGS